MTCIAFDGKTLAADKQSTQGNTKRTTTKVFRVGALLVGAAGAGDQCAEMVEWVRRGRAVAEFPASQRKQEDFCDLVVIEGGRVLVYGRSPYPMRIEDPVYATGSGRDFAMAAMFCGLDARKAVAVACQFDDGCGMGIDALDLVPPE